MHPVAGGGMLVGDVSYDTPDYHYLAASPLGGVIATDYDNFIPTGGLGFGGLTGGLGVLPPVVPGPAATVSRFPLRSFPRVSPLRRYLSKGGEGADRNLEMVMCRLRVGHTWLTQSYLSKNGEQPFAKTASIQSGIF
ncbi:hypothetical protein PoB_000892300 [Plakobranchus ocellatus]|uniref:Uncharacterized protein n=1 Tax=Plakobranchus ocellatus TaxID=259542 RepID=A0AAV3YJM8_9GAST|nr:hypothetical protein PoB_000892300 [Plakobranchus ocellatus]